MKSILDFLQFSTPTGEQKTALEAMARFVDEDNTDDFMILCGAAGTGKTSITAALVGYLNHLEIAFKIAAPTGRAARILGKKTNTISSTIHAMVYIPESDRASGKTHWKLKPNKFKDYCIYIIDEASMINAQNKREPGELFQSDDALLNSLIDFVKNGNAENKIIFLGDRNQLPPFEEDISMALDPEYLKKNFRWRGDFHYLTEVKRVEDDSYILKNAVALRESIDDNTLPMPEITARRLQHVWAAAADFAHHFNPDNLDHAITIGRSHRVCRLFNDEVRKKIFGPDRSYIQQGDLLIVLQNWKRKEQVLYNGDHVLVESVDITGVERVAGLHFLSVIIKAPQLDGTLVSFEDYICVDVLQAEDGKIDPQKEGFLRAERMNRNKVYKDSGLPEDDKYVGALRLGYGYAITCQKAQGGEWEKVYINTFGVKDKKWLYTAITRTKTSLNLY
jgi:exodeoxyribonuclease-5